MASTREIFAAFYWGSGPADRYQEGLSTLQLIFISSEQSLYLLSRHHMANGMRLNDLELLVSRVSCVCPLGAEEIASCCGAVHLCKTLLVSYMYKGEYSVGKITNWCLWAPNSHFPCHSLWHWVWWENTQVYSYMEPIMSKRRAFLQYLVYSVWWHIN